MKVDIRSPQSLFVELDGWIYYIDNSTDEQIVDKWKKEEGNDDE